MYIFNWPIENKNTKHFLDFLCFISFRAVVCLTELCVNPVSEVGDPSVAVTVSRSTGSADSSDEDMLVTLLVGQRSPTVTLETIHSAI